MIIKTRYISHLGSFLLLAFVVVGCSSNPKPQPTNIPRVNDVGSMSLADQSADSLFAIAVGFEKTGDVAQALLFYGQATSKDTQHIPSWLGIARVLQSMGNLAGSRNALQDALAYAPNNVDLLVSLASVEILDDRASQAIVHLAPITDKKDYRISNILGVAAEMMGNGTVAKDYFTDALAYNNNAADVLSNISLSFALSKDQITAVALLQDNLKRSDYREIALEQLAVIYALDGQVDAAMTIAVDLLGYDTAMNNFEFYDSLQYLPSMMQARAIYTKRLSEEMRSIARRGKNAEN